MFCSFPKSHCFAQHPQLCSMTTPNFVVNHICCILSSLFFFPPMFLLKDKEKDTPQYKYVLKRYIQLHICSTSSNSLSAAWHWLSADHAQFRLCSHWGRSNILLCLLQSTWQVLTNHTTKHVAAFEHPKTAANAEALCLICN